MSAISPPLSPAGSTSRERPRIVSTMSYMSTKSRRSSHSTKLDLVETSRDKRRLEGKSDPTKALSEAQPAAIALEASNLDNLRMMQHRDSEGNVITDPDRSNPTRSRMERPLDTIRAFNAAADGTATRRASYQSRPSSQHYDNSGRRSIHGGPGPGYPPRGPGPNPGPNRPGYGGYYRNNSYAYRPDSFAEEGSQQHMGQQQQMPPYGRPARPQQQQQQPPMPSYYPHAESPSSSHSQQPSYETMTSGSDELSRSTNPSSQNSSFDQLQQMGIKRPDFSSNFDQENMAPQNRGYAQPQQPMRNGSMQHPRYVQDRAPPPPPKPQMRVNSNGPQSPMSPAGRLQKQESVKRQSWLRRTLSRRL